MSGLPESTLNRKTLPLFIDQIKSKFHNCSVASISFLNEESELINANSISELFAELSRIAPKERTHLKFDIKFTRKAQSKKFSKASVVFGNTQANSNVLVNGGGTTASNEDIKIIVTSLAKRYKRKIPNSLGQYVFPLAVAIFLFAFNYFQPNTIFEGTFNKTITLSIFSAPFCLYFNQRPHTFIEVNKLDHFRLLYNKAAFVVFACALLLAGAASKFPILIQRDQRMVEENLDIRKEVIDKILTPEFKFNVDSLEQTIKLYDLAATIDEKLPLGKIMASTVQKMVYGQNGLANYPIGRLPIFSTSTGIDRNNWLEQAALLHLNASIIGNVGKYEYTANIKSDRAQHVTRQISLSDWLNEVVISSNQVFWTRSSLLEAETRHINDLKPADASLVDLRTRRPWTNSGTTTYKNSAEMETIRAIAEEILLTAKILKSYSSQDTIDPQERSKQ